MGFGEMRKAAASSERRREAEEAKQEADSGRRVAIQQFLNQVAPIFKAYASGGMQAEHLIEGTGLRDYAETARRLAVAVVARLTDTMPNAVDPVLVRVLMPSMAEFVARKIEVDLPVDITADSGAIIAALDLLDPKFDVNPYERNPVPQEASLKMTASAGISAIVAQLAWYDFRARDPARAASRPLDAVIARTAAVVMRIAPEMSERDRVSLMQSFVRHHSEIMANAVANRGAATLAALRDLTAEGRDAWYREHDPIGEAIERFEALSSGLEAAYVAWDAAMKDPSTAVQPQSSPGVK